MKTLPTTMLEYLEIYNIFVTAVYTEAMANIICQLHHLHLEQCFNEQKHDQN